MIALEKLLVSPETKKQLEGYINQPSHALMLVGTPGLGVRDISEALIGSLLGISSTARLHNSAQVMTINPNDNGNISIDEIREAWRYARVPASSADGKTKVVLLTDAQALTREAQNSFLKLLEEPPEYLHLILTTPSEKLLLDTIQSRVQIISIKPPSEKDIIQTLVNDYSVDIKQARQAWIMSGSEPYTAIQIVKSGGSEDLQLAKRILSLSAYKRITESADLLKDRAKAIKLSESITRLSYLAMAQAVKSDKDGQKWLKRLELSLDTTANLKANSNVRLNMINLLTSL